MNRRSFLCAAPAAVALSAVPAIACKTMTLEELCDYHAEKLCEAMRQLHGGRWDYFIDHAARCGFARQR